MLGAQAFLSVSPNTLNIAAANGSTASFNVTSNINWTVASNQTWLSVNPTNGSGNGTVTLTVEANPTSARNATVTISGKGVNSQTISVHQFGTIGVIDNDFDFIIISPLPAENKVTVRKLFAFGDIFEFKFFDLNGNLVFNGQSFFNDYIVFPKLTSGVYILTIYFNNQSKSFKIMIK